jgi:hypothetical protein
MDRQSRIRERTVPAVIAALLLTASSVALAAPTPATGFSGQATVFRATVLGTTIVLADTGPLPSAGGTRQATLVTANVPGLLTARALEATVVGAGDRADASASVADLQLTVADAAIQADLVAAEATARCEDGAPIVSGASQIVGLQVNGQPIAVSGEPNQTVTLAGATLIINEQTSQGPGDITVNALRLDAPGVASVIVSSAHADVTCGAAPPPPGPCPTPPQDFFTGGGWITGTPSGERANFGVGGGVKNGSFWGHLTYQDHGPSGPKVKATSVDSYTFVNENSRRITGQAQVNGKQGESLRYEVTVADNGEPGRADTFALSLANGYSASGTLDGGNIQLHKPKPCQ